jgi:Zn-dependent protease
MLGEGITRLGVDQLGQRRPVGFVSGLLFLGFGLAAALHIEPMKVWKIFQPGLTWLMKSQEVASWLIR